MQRVSALLAPALSGCVLMLLGGSPASAQMAAPWVSYPYYPYGYYYGYPYAYTAPLAWWAAPAGVAVAAPAIAAETAAAVPVFAAERAAALPVTAAETVVAAPVTALETAAVLPTLAASLAATPAVPVIIGRSAAEPGKSCTTPARTCLLRNISWVGNGCSCRVPGGRARGSVTP